jgi:heme/copper-type cytochrome/quinol oxidase subunit 1
MGLGRGIIGLSVISTVAAVLYADMNKTHVFNNEWPPHARFHAVVAIFATTAYALVALFLVTRRAGDAVAVPVAALMPVCAWIGHYLAFFIMGPSETEEVLGVPSNLLGGGVIASAAGAGYLLYRKQRGAVTPE